MLLAAAALPALVVGLWVGLAISRVIPDRWLRVASIAILVLIAASDIFMPYVQSATGR